MRGFTSLFHASRHPKAVGRRLPLGRIALAVAPLSFLFSVGLTTSASASSVSAVSAAANPTTPSASASYVVSYTPPGDQTLGGTISVEAAPGTTFVGCTSASDCKGKYELVQGAADKSIDQVAVSAGTGSSTNNEFQITLGGTTVVGGTATTILVESGAQNPSAPGTETLSIWTSAAQTPVSVNYTVGTEPTGLIQGAYPDGGLDEGVGAQDAPAYLQNIFGVPTETTPILGTDYTNNSDWSSITSQTALKPLAAYAIPGYQLALGVPLLPSNSGDTLANAALGDYDSNWTTFAESLCALGLGNTWLRLGYEFDNKAPSSSVPWATSNNTQDLQNFGKYFALIVETIKADEATTGTACANAGSDFKFVWNPTSMAFLGNPGDWRWTNGGMPLSSLELAWPDQYCTAEYSPCVDDIGLDTFDAEKTTLHYTDAQNWTDNIDVQLTDAQAFAQDESVSSIPFVFPEWGLMAPNQTGEPGGMGDDPTFVACMYDFMVNNNVPYESYDNVSEAGWNSEITASGTTFQNSLAEYQSAFGQGTDNCSNLLNP